MVGASRQCAQRSGHGIREGRQLRGGCRGRGHRQGRWQGLVPRCAGRWEYGLRLRKVAGRHHAGTLATPAVGAFSQPASPGESFKDCDLCPELVRVPAGSFQMGSPSYETDRDDDEGPCTAFRFRRDLAVGKFEVTRGRVRGIRTAATGYPDGHICWTLETGEWEEREGRNWRDPSIPQTDRDPVVCVSWNDAQAYVEWLSRETGKTYRLPSEAEWEYAARAGATTDRPWGRDSAPKAAVLRHACRSDQPSGLSPSGRSMPATTALRRRTRRAVSAQRFWFTTPWAMSGSGPRIA